MSINKLISIKNAIIDARDDLGLDHSADDPVFTSWATKAEKAINSAIALCRKRAVLKVTGCVAELPKDARFVQRAILGDIGCECENIFNTLCSSLRSSTTITEHDTFLIVDMGSDYSYIRGSVPHQIQDNKIVLNHNYDGQSITIQYLGFKTDPEGFIMVSENHIDAISWFIQWKYWMRKRGKSPMEYGQMKECKAEWHRECDNAGALDNELTESDRAEIVTMLHDPLIGFGMDLGTRNSL